MRPHILFSITAILAGILTWGLVDGAAAQDGQGEEAGKEFPAKFWSYLEKADYEKEWKPWPGKADRFYPGQAPHGAFLKLYVNDDVLKNPEDPPEGSVIVKENYGEDREKLMAITVMFRTKNFDPEHKNWWWVKYNAGGTVAEAKDMPIAGKVQSCISCHSNADGDDYVFTNDRPE